MAYRLVYEQNWAAGNSLFSQQQFYNRALEGSDPLYPAVNKAESVQVNIGDGPAGENTVDNWTGVGSDNDYSFEGVDLRLVNAASEATALSIVEGKMSATYTPTTQSLADNGFGYCPLMQVFQYHDTSQIFLLAAYPNGLGPTWQLELYGGSSFISASHTFTPVAGTSYTFDVEFLRSESSQGYLRVFINGAQVYNANPVYVRGNPLVSGAFPAYPIRTVWLGFFGLFGKLTNFRVYEIAELVPPPSPVNNATKCCTALSAAQSTGAGTSGGLAPSPYVPLPPPIYDCAGLGTVESVADATRPEEFA